MQPEPEMCNFCGVIVLDYWEHTKSCEARKALIIKFHKENKFPSTY